MSPAELAARSRALGLSVSDVAEIGGVDARTARYWMSGSDKRGMRLPPEDVATAIRAIEDELTRLTDSYRAMTQITLPRSTEALRLTHPDAPGPGKASGPFIGPVLVAAARAIDGAGHEIELIWHE